MNSSFQKPNIPPQQFQYFGSIVQRFPRSKDDKLGPGRYFKEDTFVKKNSSEKKHYAPFNSKTLRNVTDHHANIPGPGYYEKLQPIGKKTFSKHAVFESSEARFVEMERLTGPGPGQYSLIDPEENNKSYKGTAAFKGSPRMKPVDPDKDIENYPSVGQYNSDIVTSISYSLDKKILKPSMVNAPFNSMKNRWENINRKDYNIGPGQYFTETKIMKEQRSPPFKFADKRFRDPKGLNLGPGEYDKENYFDWNKKSYNILYL